ncbi:MAG: Asp-tRNA(Asn)/Glu-tRNA(Gln) amidotransferase subunit GatC [Ignavibacteria bacterium]|nr:Asp-tRNA(Asn)/Glu-tRNA(Gln) amidotransferase subunit GatC [Ignavibacteria bacterium]
MNPDELQKLAALSRLKFTDEQLESFAEQFNNVVEFVGKVSAEDLGDVEPMLSVNESVNVFREDVVGECLTTEEALRNAPKKNEAFFKVPKVL